MSDPYLISLAKWEAAKDAGREELVKGVESLLRQATQMKEERDAAYRRGVEDAAKVAEALQEATAAGIRALGEKE